MVTFPPAWKIKREIKRLGSQALSLPVEIARKIYFRRWYDLHKSEKITLTTGAVELGPEIAIYLIFPNAGLLSAHILAIDEMLKSGITPVIVSNIALENKDRETLLAKSAWVMERPNIGYDFGGYRDAILALSDRLPTLNRLWILNDSTFMVPQPINWFEAARALNVDFAGATSNYAMPRVDLTKFRSAKWNFDTKHKNFHYASYAWSIGPAILKDPAFLRFWHRLDIRNDKTKTVRRGEIGFSQWVIKRGFSHRATWEVEELDKELSKFSASEIALFAQDVQIVEHERLSALKSEVLTSDPSTQAGQQDRIFFILAAVSLQASAYSFPKYGIKYKNYHFIKRTLINQGKELSYFTDA